jgi:hypothetical protein
VNPRRLKNGIMENKRPLPERPRAIRKNVVERIEIATSFLKPTHLRNQGRMRD